MKTIKLYENNTYLTSCRAVVKDVKHEHASAGTGEQMCKVLFDQTVFFPEGGGQSPDVGTAVLSGRSCGRPDAETASAETCPDGDGPCQESCKASGETRGRHIFKVTDVQDEHGEVWHSLCGHAPLPAPGEEMVLEIDWEHRFDNMQRHLGEHILSGAFYRLFGAVNKGFHMGSEYMTIDLGFDHDMQDALGLPHTDQVTWKMAEEAELEANRVIWADAPVVRSHFDTREDAERMPLRKKLAFDEDISIVTVGDLPAPYDCVACCGTHPSSAGQVGLIKIYKIEPNKGMSRIFLECGRRALRHYETRLNDMYDIACDMSCGLEDLKEKYLIAKEKERHLRDKLSAMTRKVLAAEAESLAASGESAAVRCYSDLGTDDVLSLVKQMDRLDKKSYAAGTKDKAGTTDSTTLCGRPSVVILASIPELTVILVSHDDGTDCGRLVKENAPSFSGRGGGKPGMARALFSSAEDLRGFMRKISDLIR